MIDLRSDTVTKPDEGMRRAMYEAEVGDDVFGEDPTVIRLQEYVADLLGKEAALFVSSGVMGNQLGLKVNTNPGDEVIVERNAHIFNYESGAGAVLSGVQLMVLDGQRGILDPEMVRQAIRPDHYWEPRTTLICIENTVNKAGGTVYPLSNILGIAEIAREHGIALHLDGARLWNASAASGIPEKEYARPFDTVSVCLSKGLGAPVGSLIVGSKEKIRKAHRFRKLLGGGMRQVGILAAAGLYALEHNRATLPEDHDKAKRLAYGLAECPTFTIDPETVETNIVMFDVPPGQASRVIDELKQNGVALSVFGPSTIRATTHRDVSMSDIDRALDVIHSCYGNVTV